MNHTLTISPVTTLFDFHPFEAHRVGGIVVVTHVSRTNGQEKRTFAALGTCLGGEEGEVKIIGTYRRRRTKKERGKVVLSSEARAMRNKSKNAARARRRALKEAA